MLFLYPFLLEFLFLIKYKLLRGDPSKDIMKHNHEKFTGKIPICYRHEYNFTACGLEKLHPFDSSKYRNGVYCLKKSWLFFINNKINQILKI